MKGKINNLFALGTFTETDYTNVALFETALRATVKYLQKYEPTLKGFHKTKTNDALFYIILTTILIL